MSSCFSQPVEATDDLEGDLLIGNDTQHDKVYEARKSDSLDVVGALNVKPIKDKMRALENQYQGAVANGIKLSDINTSFTATMTLPEGLEFSAPHRLVLEGAKGKFEMINPTINGQLLTVELRLVGANNIDTYKKLADAINDVSDTLKSAPSLDCFPNHLNLKFTTFPLTVLVAFAEKSPATVPFIV